MIARDQQPPRLLIVGQKQTLKEKHFLNLVGSAVLEQGKTEMCPGRI